MAVPLGLGCLLERVALGFSGVEIFTRSFKPNLGADVPIVLFRDISRVYVLSACCHDPSSCWPVVAWSYVARKNHSPIDPGVQTVARLFGSQLNERSPQTMFLAAESLFDSAGLGQSTAFFATQNRFVGRWYGW